MPISNTAIQTYDSVLSIKMIDKKSEKKARNIFKDITWKGLYIIVPLMMTFGRQQMTIQEGHYASNQTAFVIRGFMKNIWDCPMKISYRR